MMPGTEIRLAANVLEAHPHPTLLVDGERRIVLANGAARGVLGAEAGRDLAAALGCVEAPFGPCRLTSRCARCAVGQVIAAALDGRRAQGRAFLIRGGEGGQAGDLHVLVSGAPLQRAGAPHAVLVLQDLNAIVGDPSLVRVCGGCGRIAAGDGEWYPLHRCLEDRLGLEPSDALCPVCAGQTHQR